MNFNFNFQGCQIKYIRVAVSQKANKIELPDIPENHDYLIIENVMILLVLGDFWHLYDFWVEVCCSPFVAMVGAGGCHQAIFYSPRRVTFDAPRCVKIAFSDSF